MAEEPVPVVLLGRRVPRPVGLLGVGEDDARVAIAPVAVAPHVVVAKGRGGIGARGLKPRVLIGGVVHDEVGDDPQPALVRRVEESLEVLNIAVGRMNPVEVRDVVTVVPQRRRIHRQDPQTVHPQLTHVIQLRRQPRKIPDPIAVPIKKRLHMHLIENRVLIPVLHATLPPRMLQYRRTSPSARAPHDSPRGKAGDGGGRGSPGGSVGFDGRQDTRTTAPNLGGHDTEVSRGTPGAPPPPTVPGRVRARLTGCTRPRASGGRGLRRRSRSSPAGTRGSRAARRRAPGRRAASGTRRESGRRRRGRPPGARRG